LHKVEIMLKIETGSKFKFTMAAQCKKTLSGRYMTFCTKHYPTGSRVSSVMGLFMTLCFRCTVLTYIPVFFVLNIFPRQNPSPAHRVSRKMRRKTGICEGEKKLMCRHRSSFLKNVDARRRASMPAV